MTNVAVDEYGGLLCPICGGANLHHELVEVFDRKKEDSTTGWHVSSGDGKPPRIDTQMKGNPSERRDGIIVHMWCENCTDEGGNPVPIELTIAQHKGTTFLLFV